MRQTETWSKNSQHSQVFQKTRIHIEFTNRVNIITLESTSLSVIFFGAIFWYDFCSSTLQLRGSNHLKGKLGGAIVITCTAQLNHTIQPPAATQNPKPLAWPWLWRYSPQDTQQKSPLDIHLKAWFKAHPGYICTNKRCPGPLAAAVTWLGAAVLMCT